jgi:hypothetical protein
MIITGLELSLIKELISLLPKIVHIFAPFRGKAKVVDSRQTARRIETS